MICQPCGLWLRAVFDNLLLQFVINEDARCVIEAAPKIGQKESKLAPAFGARCACAAVGRHLKLIVGVGVHASFESCKAQSSLARTAKNISGGP